MADFAVWVKGQGSEWSGRMKEYDLKELTNEYIENAVIQGESQFSGDFKKGNKASNKLFKIRAIMKENRDIAIEMLNILLDNENISVLSWAAGDALDLKYRDEEAEQLLKKIARMPETGILGFIAEMELEFRGIKL